MDPSDQNANVAVPDAPLAGRREWVGLAVLALACLLYAMDLTVLHLAVPSLSAELRPSSAELLWITDIYGFMVSWSPWGRWATGSAAVGCCCGALPRLGWSRCWPPCPPAPSS
jgi:hypothetical protein